MASLSSRDVHASVIALCPYYFSMGVIQCQARTEQSPRRAVTAIPRLRFQGREIAPGDRLHQPHDSPAIHPYFEVTRLHVQVLDVLVGHEPTGVHADRPAG